MKAITRHDLAWQDQGSCREIGGDTFFIEHGGTATPARETCSHCPVRRECLVYALSIHDDWGIWGGSDGDERRRMRDRARYQHVDVITIADRWLHGEQLRFSA